MKTLAANLAGAIVLILLAIAFRLFHVSFDHAFALMALGYLLNIRCSQVVGD